MQRLAILNSYNLSGQQGTETERVRNFIDALSREGWVAGKDVEIVLVDSEEPAQTALAARRLVDEGVDLIHTIGTPNSVIAAETTSQIPIVYYGAHPEGIGDEACSQSNVTGHILALPFTSSYKKFRFLRRLVPRTRVVWSPFFEGTVFVRPAMRQLHRRHMANGRRRWIHGDSEEIGFRTLAGLCYVIEVEYRELVYSSTRQLEEALRDVRTEDGVLMPYNDTFHCPGAVDLLIEWSEQVRIPVIWNNNFEVTTRGALCGIGGDFAWLGGRSGRLAASLLNGADPRQSGRVAHNAEVSWINLRTAHELGLSPDEDLLAQFDRVIMEREEEQQPAATGRGFVGKK